MSLDDSTARSLARFAIGELAAIRTLAGLAGLPPEADEAAPDGPLAPLAERARRLSEAEVLGDAERLAAALHEVPTWTWYRFAVSHGVNAKFLDDLVARVDSDDPLLRELRDAMRGVSARLQGGWIDVRFDEADPEIKRRMEVEIAAGLRAVVTAISQLADRLESAS